MNSAARRLSWATSRGGRILRYLARQMPWHWAGDSQAAQNIRNLYAETAWFGALNGVAATFVSVFALRLGASTGQVGWLSALPALVNVVWLIPAARLIERRRRRMPLILVSGLLQRLGYLAMAAMPFLLATGRVQALIVINALITLPTAVINTAITSLIPELTPAERRGQVVSARWLLLSIVATTAALLGGRFLDMVPVPLNYQILLGAGTLLSMVGLLYLRRIRVPDAVRLRRAAEPQWRFSFERVRRSLSGITAHRGFVRYTAASFVFYWGLYLPAALWSVIRVRDLAATDTWIGVIAVIIEASTIAGYFYWGKAGSRWGDRRLLIVTSFGVTLYAALTALVPSIEWMVLTSIVGGLSWAGCNLALFNVMLNVCPAEHRPTYVALHAALMNVAAFAGPLLGAGLDDWIGIRPAFGVAAGVRLVGTVLLILLVREGTEQVVVRSGTLRQSGKRKGAGS